ncbi:MAG: Rne/Rng family ribonuclease [Planctomycetota bacterium]
MSKHQMIINYVPGEECRVAIVEDGKLEELYAERFSAASRVGNIYVGRVNNVEASIQAAFVDFGVEDNGFLHISDLHPRYFPGEDDNATEQVGHKTPRRERPLIQHALRKGDEVIVQVLKEGVGTKGPTLTSYLSIPGRFLVMMPQMDKVGVSRKVEDEETRRAMREILDQLELPEGFGFILRTAGMDRSKLELKRDLAYLQRLWKDMEKRRKTGSKPRLMYSESDLLVRCLRDVLTNDMDEVIIDNEQALVRGERFMKIVAPRTKTKLAHYPGKTPIFHAYGIERQISLIHAREGPLPSGGRLVIDQTEALVAIDVNSGRSRDARDAEDNAYKTNIEAVDEICRQLRLRDLGGIVVNDLIDMRSAAHRKDIENRFRERLKRDRAKSTVAPISPFGILEMTRQRMRGSHEQLHFSDCPICRGRGLVQKPDSVAGEALRELAAYLDYERISKVELVVSPRVAGELLSNKRRLLGRIERESGKHVEMRVSEDIPPDRVSFYAYELDGADVDLERLPPPRRPENLKVWEFDPPVEGEDVWSGDPLSERQQALAAEAQADDALDKADSDLEPHPIEIDEPDSATGDVALDA